MKGEEVEDVVQLIEEMGLRWFWGVRGGFGEEKDVIL